MAKAKQTDTAPADDARPQPTIDNSAVPAEDRSLAMQVIMDITGCGRTEAAERVNTIDIAKLVQLERAGKRPEIVQLLY